MVFGVHFCVYDKDDSGTFLNRSRDLKIAGHFFIVQSNEFLKAPGTPKYFQPLN